MELIIGSIIGTGLLLVGHLGVLVHDRLLGLTHGRDRSL
jgi:hypothetical protein